MEDAAAIASLPSENPPPPVTAESIARAAIQVGLEKQDADAAKAVREQYTIEDPGQKPAPKPEARVEPEPANVEPATKPEAKVNEQLLERIAQLEERLNNRVEYEPAPQQTREPLIKLPSKRRNAETGQEEPMEWEPEVVEFATNTNRIIEQLAGEVNRLKETDAQRDQRLAWQAREHKSEAFDQWIAKEESLHDVLGSGTRGTVSKSEFEARNQIYLAAEAIENVFRQTGKRPPSWEECLGRAKAAIHPERVAAGVRSATQKDLSDKLRDSAGKFISRPQPAGKLNDMPKGDARAKAALGAKLREQGYEEYD
jgi:hypothetical protein